MGAIQYSLNRIARVLLAISGLALVAMMFVVIFDVIVRNLSVVLPFLNEITYYGTIEIVRYLFLLAMAGAMPWGVEKSQVIVELFTQRLSDTAKVRVDAFFLLGFAALGALMAYSLFVAGSHAFVTGETTPDLQIPIGPIRYATGACMALMALRALVEGLLGLKQGVWHAA
ncbi:TRAP transporter small permease [Achromobacter sp. GG226]|uniref:TRAP transporter small permease n=1 Tax=Verticiella alkaliphila TaxID=2779529 RepID=UPI001C0DE748|nr:TRAP transporter small permease subunit [Verticiella sp. GG226]MBU4611408.1 TRAP transporter small permease [Verticiella sp. GG226]